MIFFRLLFIEFQKEDFKSHTAKKQTLTSTVLTCHGFAKNGP